MMGSILKYDYENYGILFTEPTGNNEARVIFCLKESVTKITKLSYCKKVVNYEQKIYMQCPPIVDGDFIFLLVPMGNGGKVTFIELTCGSCMTLVLL